MTEDIEIRPFFSGDEYGIVRLLKLVFKGWPQMDLDCSELEHWRWKYLDNPLGSSVISLGISNGETVGCSHTILSNRKIGDRNFSCLQGADVAVHPSFREKGIFSRMTDQRIQLSKERNIGIILWGTSNPILVKRWKRVSTPFPHVITNFVRINDINMQLRSMPVKNVFIMRIGFHVIKYLNDINLRLRSNKAKKPKIAVSEISVFDDRINEFWDKVSSSYDFIMERKREYLNWRYCDRRAGSFVVKQAEDNERVVGFIVLRINRHREDYPVGFIVDLLCLPERFDAVDALVSDAVQYFEANKINLVNILVVKNYPATRILNNHDFLNSRIRYTLFYDQFNSVFNLKEINANRIHFSFGDFDSLPSRMPRS